MASVSELLVKLPKFRRAPFLWFCTASGEGGVETSSEMSGHLRKLRKTVKILGTHENF